MEHMDGNLYHEVVETCSVWNMIVFAKHSSHASWFAKCIFGIDNSHLLCRLCGTTNSSFSSKISKNLFLHHTGGHRLKKWKTVKLPAIIPEHATQFHIDRAQGQFERFFGRATFSIDCSRFIFDPFVDQLDLHDALNCRRTQTKIMSLFLVHWLNFPLFVTVVLHVSPTNN